MRVTYHDLKLFMEKDIMPTFLSYELASAWLRCKKLNLNYEKIILPRLSSRDLNIGIEKQYFDFGRLAKIITYSCLDIQGCVFFCDSECYVKFIKSFDETNYNKFFSYLGYQITEKYIGNHAANMASSLLKPVFLSGYEHINSLFHRSATYCEPVFINNSLIGIMGVTVVNMDMNMDRKIVYSLLRLLMNSCKIDKKQNNIKKGSTHFYAKYSFEDIVYRSKEIERCINTVKLLSKSDQPLLITGESGVGKELFASAVHNESLRQAGPFVPINCAAINSNLLESELFGYSEGAFTGAIKGGRKGKFELADGGTLFLDEIGDLSSHAQAVLLRALQENEFMRVGDEKVTQVNVRIICATNKDLLKLCEENYFRRDLYYRIAGFTINIPPLRERKEDLELIALAFIEQLNNYYGSKKILLDTCFEILNKYNYPGNVRELRNILHTAYLMSSGTEIKKEVFYDLLKINDFVNLNLENKQKKLKEILDSVNGNVSQAAKILNISRNTVYRWLREENIDLKK